MRAKIRQYKSPSLLLVVVLLCGCSPTRAPQTKSPTPLLNTSTPAADAISISNIDQLALLDSFSGSDSRILDLDLSSDGAWLAYSAQDRSITLWEVQSGQVAHTFPMMSVDMADLDISPDDQWLATGEMIWDLETGEEIHVLERGSPLPGHVDFSPDGSTLALGMLDSEITMWDVASGEPVFSFPQEEDNRTKALVFSPDGALLVVGVIDGSIRIYDVEQAQMVNLFHHPAETDIHDLAVSSNGNYVAHGGRYPGVILWDLHSGEVFRTYSVRDDIYSVAISPDSTIVAAGGGYEEAVLLWDLQNGRLLRTLPMDNKSRTIAFSADGRFLVAGDFDGQIYIWAIASDP